MDVRDEGLDPPLTVAVALPGVVRQVQVLEAEPVREAGRQHAGQAGEAARGEVQPPQPPGAGGGQGGQGPGLGVQPVQPGAVAHHQGLQLGGGGEGVLLYRGQNLVVTEGVKMTSYSQSLNVDE